MSPSLRNFHWLATLSVILGLVFLYEVVPPVPVHIGSAALFALGTRAIAEDAVVSLGIYDMACFFTLLKAFLDKR